MQKFILEKKKTITYDLVWNKAKLIQETATFANCNFSFKTPMEHQKIIINIKQIGYILFYKSTYYFS